MAASVLIVDDNALYRESLHRLLKSCYPQANLTIVSDGSAALQMLRQRPFDLLMLDYQLPGLSGGDVVRRLRGSGQLMPYASPTIILMSTQPDVSIFARSLGVAFLAKPCTASDLEQMLDPLLAGSSGPDDTKRRLKRIQLR
jgi:CheY-like chemotaxis protein